MKKQPVVRELGQTRRLAILEALQRSPEGLSVKGLVSLLGMSYMGIKNQCINLQNQGYLKTWRQSQERGRPQIFYRLTPKAAEFFSEQNHDFLLSILLQSKKLFGESAAQKLLLMHFRSTMAFYTQQIKEQDPVKRAEIVAKMRDREGYISHFEPGSPWRIVEYKHPYLRLIEAYPQVANLETQFLGSVIGVPVKRIVNQIEGSYRAEIIPQ